MTEETTGSEGLLRVLTAQFHALVAARSDGTLLGQYSVLLRFLRSSRCAFLEDATHVGHRTNRSRSVPSLSEESLRKASLNDIEKIVKDDAAPRKDLEFIAIQRFSVPRGSMRRFANRQMLVEKLRTLIDNERTHETIAAVARGPAKPASDTDAKAS